MRPNEAVIRNEKAKLLAMFLNNCGVAAIAGGFLGLFWQIALTQDSHATVVQNVILLLAIAIGVGLHVLARVVLNELQDVPAT